MPSESDALRAERDELLEALRQCQSALAMLTAPDAIRMTTVQHAWATAVAAEARARQAIARSEAFPLEVSGKDPPSVGA